MQDGGSSSTGDLGHRPYRASPFSRFAKLTAHATGHPLAFLVAVLTIAGWAITGPLFGYSDTWQLVINTGTTIVTFLMVFLIQNTQNRDSAAVQLKLDELIRSMSDAENELLDIEELTDADLERLKARYEALAQRAREERQRDPADAASLAGRPSASRARAQRRSQTQPAASPESSTTDAAPNSAA
jgi:low affinity Fe/Cu permease